MRPDTSNNKYNDDDHYSLTSNGNVLIFYRATKVLWRPEMESSRIAVSKLFLRQPRPLRAIPNVCLIPYKLLTLKEETDRTGSILKAGLHLGPEWGLGAICPVSMETTYQPENQTPGGKSLRAHT